MEEAYRRPRSAFDETTAGSTDRARAAKRYAGYLTLDHEARRDEPWP